MYQVQQVHMSWLHVLLCVVGIVVVIIAVRGLRSPMPRLWVGPCLSIGLILLGILGFWSIRELGRSRAEQRAARAKTDEIPAKWHMFGSRPPAVKKKDAGRKPSPPVPPPPPVPPQITQKDSGAVASNVATKASGKTSVAASQTAPPSGPILTVVGIGESAKDAEQEALEKAQAEVIALLRQQSPPIEWVPPIDYVKKKLVRGITNEGTKDLPPPVGRVYQVSVRVGLDSETRSEILKLDRHARTSQRMLFLVEILGGIVVVCTAIAGYIRLDELSKGYYTGLLRLAAVGLVAVVVAGLWFFTTN